MAGLHLSRYHSLKPTLSFPANFCTHRCKKGTGNDISVREASRSSTQRCDAQHCFHCLWDEMWQLADSHLVEFPTGELRAGDEQRAGVPGGVSPSLTAGSEAVKGVS